MKAPHFACSFSQTFFISGILIYGHSGRDLGAETVGQTEISFFLNEYKEESYSCTAKSIKERKSYKKEKS
jgi:hypothetical protein